LIPLNWCEEVLLFPLPANRVIRDHNFTSSAGRFVKERKT
jgi:hypothetical protein